MKSAGKSLLLAVFLLLVAASKSNAQDLETLSLVKAQKSPDICQSPLKPYVLTHTKDCPLSEFRQVQNLGNVKEAKAEKFSVAHSIKEQTYTPTPTPTRIVSEIKIATPSPTAIVAEANINPVSNNADVVFELVNQHRASIGKTAFIKDDALCSLAQVRSNELAGEGANGTLHAGLYNRNLPHWTTENAKIGGDETETVRWWLNSSIHRSQIQSDYTNACVGCTGRNCALVFTSYTPKGNRVATTDIAAK